MKKRSWITFGIKLGLSLDQIKSTFDYIQSFESDMDKITMIRDFITADNDIQRKIFAFWDLRFINN